MKVTNYLSVIIFILFLSTIGLAQVSPKKGVTPPAHFVEFQQMIQSEYSKGYYAEKFKEKKQTRELISQGLLPEAALVEDTVRALTLMGQYTNLSGFYTQQEFQAQLYDGPNPTGTVTDYYTEVSYNQLYFTGDANGWYDMPRTLEEYEGGNSGLGPQGGPRFVWEILQVSDPSLNFADYIQYYDGQGRPRIGFMAIVHAGAGAEAGANNIWSHRWDFRVFSGAAFTTNDVDPVSGFNVIIDGPYAIMPERSGGSNTSGSLIEIGVFAHEFGHIFGLPDLYDTDGSSSGLGNWCLMAGGAWGGNSSSPETPTHMSAWCKKQMGWVTPINITSLEKALSVPNVEENPIIYRMWKDGTLTQQYFLVENRQRIGFDANIYESGFLIYHVDDTQSGNQNENRYKVDLEQADGLRNLNNNQGRGDAGDPFPGLTNNTRFDWNTNPNSKDYNLNNTFVSVRNIRKNGTNMIGDFNVFSGPYLFTEKILLELATGEAPLVKTVTITNYGFDNLVINDIVSQVGPFTLLNEPTYPFTLATNESMDLDIQFNSNDVGFYTEFMEINDNDPSVDGITLNGRVYVLNPANNGIFYSTANTNPQDTGKTIWLDKNTGVGTELGKSNFSAIRTLTVHPVTNFLYGAVPGETSSDMVRVNSTEGDAYTLYTLQGIGLMVAVAFDTAGSLYCATQSGGIYTIDLANGSTSLVTTTIPVRAIAFDPLTNDLWAAPWLVIGQKDKIFKIHLITGDTTNVGRTGFNAMTNDLAFDEHGALYGIIGGASLEGKLISIDRTTASGTEIGGTGFINVQSLAYSINGRPNSVKEIEITPKEFYLAQNYPNPFNPTTRIEFSLPVTAYIELTVYNVLGQQVATLLNEQRNAGNHSIVWNANDASGAKLSSGIYFYKLNAKRTDGGDFVQIRKMVLIK